MVVARQNLAWIGGRHVHPATRYFLTSHRLVTQIDPDRDLGKPGNGFRISEREQSSSRASRRAVCPANLEHAEHLAGTRYVRVDVSRSVELADDSRASRDRCEARER
jgi:hypothetical protein